MSSSFSNELVIQNEKKHHSETLKRSSLTTKHQALNNLKRLLDWFMLVSSEDG